MTIDEAIKHCEEVAEKHERHLKVYENIGEDRPLFKEEENECKECAKEHRQLAEWLKELNKYREFADWLVQAVLEDDWEENADFYAEVLCRKLTKLGKIKVVDNEYMEVNADGERNSN